MRTPIIRVAKLDKNSISNFIIQEKNLQIILFFAYFNNQKELPYMYCTEHI